MLSGSNDELQIGVHDLPMAVSEKGAADSSTPHDLVLDWTQPPDNNQSKLGDYARVRVWKELPEAVFKAVSGRTTCAYLS